MTGILSRFTIGTLREVAESAMVTQCGIQWTWRKTLNVKSAFKSLKWSDVLMEYKFSIKHYILTMMNGYRSNIQLVYNTSSWPNIWNITSGAVQGSILGQDLWNVNYDGYRSDCIRSYCICYHVKEYGRGTAKIETRYAENENMVEIPRSRPGHALNGITANHRSS